MKTRSARSPRVTVVMSVYNGKPYLGEAVDSILRQSFTDFEFIIIDDGSTDGTSDVLAAHDDPRIRVVRKDHRGLTASLQTGFELARGELFARQDSDDISLRTRLELQVRFLESHPKVIALGTSCVEVDEQGNELRKKSVPLDDRGCKMRLSVSSPIVHGSAMVRMGVMRDVGGYRADFRVGQDRDLWLRLSERGMLANTPESLYLWRRSPTSISTLQRSAQKRMSDRALVMAVQRMGDGADELGGAVAGVEQGTLANHRLCLGMGLLARRHFRLGIRLTFGPQSQIWRSLAAWRVLLQGARQVIRDYRVETLARAIRDKVSSA